MRPPHWRVLEAALPGVSEGSDGSPMARVPEGCWTGGQSQGLDGFWGWGNFLGGVGAQETELPDEG